MMYRCIHCLSPCASLYHEYTTAGSSSNNSSNNNNNNNNNSKSKVLKLNQCTNCQFIVDPYCEREWLLIVLDLILLRPESYRHVLCNNNNNNTDNDNNDNTRNDNNNNSNLVESFGLDVFCGCCALRVFHQFLSLTKDQRQDLQSFFYTLNDHTTNSSPPPNISISKDMMVWLLQQFFLSFIGLVVFILILVVGIVPANNTDLLRDNSQSTRMIFKSVCWPLIACQLATCWMEIWENNSTMIRSLGCTVLVLLYQWMALYQTFLVATITTTKTMTQQSFSSSCSPPTTVAFTIRSIVKITGVLMVAVILRSFVTIVWKQLHQQQYTTFDILISPCPGLEWNLSDWYDEEGPIQISLCLA